MGEFELKDEIIYDMALKNCDSNCKRDQLKYAKLLLKEAKKIQVDHSYIKCNKVPKILTNIMLNIWNFKTSLLFIYITSLIIYMKQIIKLSLFFFFYKFI